MGEKQRLFPAVSHQAESWDRPRGIISKVEYGHLGGNVRLVVTNLVRTPRFVYDDLSVPRGEVENRVQELKLELKAGRLSCHRFLANRFRLLRHTAAHCLSWLLRRHLEGTELATAQVSTPAPPAPGNRGPHPFEVRRLWVHLASGYPYRDLLAGLLYNLRASPP